MKNIVMLFIISSMVILTSEVFAFTSPSTTICESWTRVSNDPNHEDWWNFDPVNIKTTWYVGEAPIILSKIINPTENFSWRTDLYRNGVYIRLL